MKTVVTHSGSFHADDAFAVATLQLVHGVENVEIIRTRDEAIIALADIVVDVGGEYDISRMRFDHHQNGVPVRDNGIPYAAFGLVWRKYGENVAGTQAVANEIERLLVLAVDAGDTGISLYTLKDNLSTPYELYQIISSFAPVWGSGCSKDDGFLEAVAFARALLLRIIAQKTAEQTMRQLIADTYTASSNKSILLFDTPISAVACTEYPEVLCVVCPNDPASNQNWTATLVRKT